MSGKRFRARAKKLQKLGRDGLVEQDQVTGEERRVGQRAADVSFGPKRDGETAAPRRLEGRAADQDSGKDGKKRRRQRRPTGQTAEETAWAKPKEETVPYEPQTPSMRMAADAPLLAPPEEPAPVLPIPPPKRRRRKRRSNRKKLQRRQTAMLARDAAPRGPQDAPLRNKPRAGADERPSRLTMDGGRLHFEDNAGDATDVAAADAAHTPAKGAKGGAETRRSRLRDDGGGRLRFEDDTRDTAAQRETENRRTAAQAAHAADAAVYATDTVAQAADAAANAAKPDGHSTPDSARDSGASPDPAGSGEKKRAGKLDKRVKQSEKRVEKSGKRLEKARKKLPTKRRLHLERGYDPEAKKTRRRLQFEKETIPEGAKPALPRRAGGAVLRTAGTAASMRVHTKLREAEQDNVGVEAAHKTEFVAERGVGRLLRYEKERLHTRPYRLLHKAERRLVKDEAELAWRKALRDTPALRKQWEKAKWWQRRKIKRKYAAAARKAQKTAQHTQTVVNATGQIVRAAAQLALAHKSLLAVVALLALVVLFFSTSLSSCTAMLSGFQSSHISTAYMADEDDICNAELYYTELEADLQLDINMTEINYPDYDEYTYSVGEIRHNPYELMAYLSTAHNAFRFSSVKSEIEELFQAQYHLERTVVTHPGILPTHTLQTTLTVTPLTGLIAGKLAPGEQTDRYGVYMQTLGNRQAFGNPFDFPWLGYVSRAYGWQVDETGFGKVLNRGIDLTAAQGTPIRAVHDGRVVPSGDAGAMTIVIEDEKGYQSRYSPCGSVSVSVGQEVKRGDVIATVGGAATTAGPHLHLEVLLNGEYLDPYYFVDTGGSGAGGGAAPGTPGGPVIPEYPGEPPSNMTFAAMLSEAKKYIGYPYVWGGSSPSTSFDCSGYVSWVINHSGWNFGRLTAQGLFNVCTPVSTENAKPGDLVFFTKTYSTAEPVTHVGIYIGNNKMLHCGNPIGYADLTNSYWQAHLYAFGRLP